MKILALADIHGSLKNIERISSSFTDFDLVLLVGDIGPFGNLQGALEVVDLVKRQAKAVLAVAGNCDSEALEPALAMREVSIHSLVECRGKMDFAGLGGSLPCPAPTPHEFSDDEMCRLLDACSEQLSNRPHILASHQPPKETMADRISDGEHVGSYAVRRYIEETRPLACICGHIHEGRSLDQIGTTKIINTGAFNRGHYATLEIEKDVITAELCEL